MELMKAIEARYTCRGYLDKQISEEMLDTIIHAGKCAPVGLKQYGDFLITVIQDKDLISRIDAAAENRRRPGSIFYGAPTLIIVSGKPSADFAHMEQCSAACIIENMLLAATDLGLGSVFHKSVIAVLEHSPELTAELSLPNGFVPIAGMAVGYADESNKDGAASHEIKVSRL